MALDENIKMLLLGSRLNLRTPALERLEIYVVDQFELQVEEYMKNEALLVAYMGTYLARKKCSRIMIQQGIRFAEMFFDVLREPDTPEAGRQKLRQLLGILELQCLAEYKDERLALIELINRDPTLTEDEFVEAQEDEERQMQLEQDLKGYFRSEMKDAIDF